MDNIVHAAYISLYVLSALMFTYVVSAAENTVLPEIDRLAADQVEHATFALG